MDSLDVKQCCATVYGSEAARFLLGDSFHPGGVELTGRLAKLLKLTPQSRILDVASGKGTSALYLAETLGCHVTGIDLSRQNIDQSSADALNRGLKTRAAFQVADAERLPFEAGIFDAILCECAFCTFPDKRQAATEFSRVLKPGGRIGISDLTRSPEPLPELDGLLAWIACIGDAQPLESYAAWLMGAGLVVENTEVHDHCLAQMVDHVRSKLLVADVMRGLGKLDVPGLDTTEANRFARAASAAVRAGKLGYGLVIARKAAAGSA